MNADKPTIMPANKPSVLGKFALSIEDNFFNAIDSTRMAAAIPRIPKTVTPKSKSIMPFLFLLMRAARAARPPIIAASAAIAPIVAHNLPGSIDANKNIDNANTPMALAKFSTPFIRFSNAAALKLCPIPSNISPRPSSISPNPSSGLLNACNTSAILNTAASMPTPRPAASNLPMSIPLMNSPSLPKKDIIFSLTLDNPSVMVLSLIVVMMVVPIFLTAL